jgi:AcrR family transcriptional regulator
MDSEFDVASHTGGFQAMTTACFNGTSLARRRAFYHKREVMSQISRESRTERRILDQAVGALADDPGRAIQEIAEVTGIGRATLYRYFRKREDLRAAITQRVLEEAERAIAESQLQESTGSSGSRACSRSCLPAMTAGAFAQEAIARLVTRLWRALNRRS